MSEKIRFCQVCRNNMKPTFYGYWPANKENDYICPICHNNMTQLEIDTDDYFVMRHVSKDVNFIEAMIKLHDEDIIEYESRMSQFRANDQWYQEKHNPKPEVKSKPDVLTCPKCGSTAVTTGARGANHFWGLIGASKTVNRCGNCGHTWKPRG